MGRGGAGRAGGAETGRGSAAFSSRSTGADLELERDDGPAVLLVLDGDGDVGPLVDLLHGRLDDALVELGEPGVLAVLDPHHGPVAVERDPGRLAAAAGDVEVVHAQLVERERGAWRRSGSGSRARSGRRAGGCGAARGGSVRYENSTWPLLILASARRAETPHSSTWVLPEHVPLDGRRRQRHEEVFEVVRVAGRRAEARRGPRRRGRGGTRTVSQWGRSS